MPYKFNVSANQLRIELAQVETAVDDMSDRERSRLYAILQNGAGWFGQSARGKYSYDDPTD